MDATPDCYKTDITRTRQAIEQLDWELEALRNDGVPAGSGCLVVRQTERAQLERQLAALEEGLERAERLWAEAHPQQEEVAMGEQEQSDERTRRLAGLVRALEALADELEQEQRFSDAHRLNEAVAYAAAVQRTLEQREEPEHKRRRIVTWGPYDITAECKKAQDSSSDEQARIAYLAQRIAIFNNGTHPTTPGPSDWADAQIALSQYREQQS
jgi:hypothetical protein